MKSKNCGSLRIKYGWVDVFCSVHLYTNLQFGNQIKIAKLKSYSILFPSCLLASSITKTHNFMIIACSPTSNYANFSNHFFGLHLKFYLQISRPKHSENVDD